MSRRLRFLSLAAAIICVGLIAYWNTRDPERRTLDAAARSGAPGYFMSLPQGVTHYDVTGPDTGRVVVLVHGMSVPMYIWDSTVVALREAGFRVIRYDLYGRGLSDRPNTAYDGALYDAQINGLLDSLRIKGKVDIIGLSFGGFVTAHYVGNNAARVRTLILMDPVASSPTLPVLLRVPLFGQWFYQVTQMPGKAESQLTDFLHPDRFPDWPVPYRAQMRYKGFGRSLLRTAFTLSHTDFDALFGAVAKTGVPVLLIWGRQDPTVPFKLSEVVRRDIPALEFAPIDSSGHLPHMEQASVVRERIAAFFAAHRE